MKKLRIETERETAVHFDFGMATLCGLETIGDSAIGIEEGVPTSDKVDCNDCISIVEFCQSIGKREFRRAK